MSVCPICNAQLEKGRYCGQCGTLFSLQEVNSNAPEPLPETGCKDSGNVLSTPKEQADSSDEKIAVLVADVKKNPDSWDAYLRLAQAQIEAKHIDGALSAFLAANSIAPHNIEILRLGASIFDLLGNREKALDVYEEILSIDEKDVESAVKSAQLLHEAGLREKALERLQTLRDKAQEYPEIHLRLARVHLSLGDTRNAIIDLTNHKSAAGSTRETYLLLGEAMMLQSFFDGAIRNYQEAMKLFPGDVDIRIALAKAYIGSQESGQALLELERALNSAPERIEILLELGKLYGDMGMEDKAESMFERIRSQYVRDGEIFLDLAGYYRKRGKLAQAQSHLERAKECSPHHPEIIQMLADVLESQKSYARALAEYEAFAASNPECNWAIKGIIKCSEVLKRYDRMAKAQKTLLDITGENPELWCDYAETLIKMHAFAEAEKAFEEAARIDPSCVRAYQSPEMINIEKARAEGEQLASKAREAIQKKFFMTAIERLERALELVPKEPEWMKLLANTCLKTGELAKAADLFTKIRVQDSNDAKSTFQLARLYEWEEKPQLAIELLSSLIMEQPGNMEAGLALIRLRRAQIKGERFERDFVDSIVRNIHLELASLKDGSPVPPLLEAYSMLLYGYKTKFQSELFRKAESLFKDTVQRFGENIWASRGLSIIHRISGELSQAAVYLNEIVKQSSDPESIYALARLYLNFQHYGEARKYLTSLTNLFPENGWYRFRLIDVIAMQTESGGKNELMNFLSPLQERLRKDDTDVWLLIDIAKTQALIARQVTQRDEWAKKSLLSWHKAVSHPAAPPWAVWGLMETQAEFLKSSERLRCLNQNLKYCERLAREIPDSVFAHYFLGICYMSFQDLEHGEKALSCFETAFFLEPTFAEIGVQIGYICKELGKSGKVDAVRYNMLLLEPELTR